MPRRKPIIMEPVIVYDRNAVLDITHVANALRTTIGYAKEMDLPCFYVGTRPKFIWGQVLDFLAEKADEDAKPDERSARPRGRKAS